MKSKISNKGEKRDEFFLITALFSRRLAYPLAVIFHRLGLSANMVTVLGGCLWILSVIAIIFAGWLWSGAGSVGLVLLVVAIVFWNLGFILDVADGSIARMTGTSTSSGSFLDFVFHLIFQPMYFCSIGVFLFFVSWNVFYLVIGVLSICSGWGVSFGSKEHVLCEHIAKRSTDISAFSDDEVYRIFIDSVRTRTPVSEKRTSIVGRLCSLVEEFVCFPGQYMLMTSLVVADLIVMRWFDVEFLFLKFGFVAISLVTLARVPFRIRREFRTLVEYDEIRARGNGKL